jgi:aryl-alcohol dehydrogenase-like predicted oxidoreductase
MIPGFATSTGTSRYRDRFPQLRDSGHFRRPEHVPGVGDLWLSSIGMGTYLGETNEAADRSYMEAIATALRSGINLLDTAINYRHQRSERNIGAALKELIEGKALRRDEVLICTKAGYLAFDGEMPADARTYFMNEYIRPGILDLSQLTGGSHCIAPAYLANQIERSRFNLGVETIDTFYIHNPESQLAVVDRAAFLNRLKDAFMMLEEAVGKKRIRFYGIATWNGLRTIPSQQDYLSLEEIIGIAQEVGGEGHHFRFVQLPFNLGMAGAFGLANQEWHGEKMSVMKLAASAGVAVVGSATLHQGQLTRSLPEFVAAALGMANDAENAIQFSRSAPGITTSLIGMGRSEHVRRNLVPALQPTAPAERWSKLFDRA